MAHFEVELAVGPSNGESKSVEVHSGRNQLEQFPSFHYTVQGYFSTIKEAAELRYFPPTVGQNRRKNEIAVDFKKNIRTLAYQEARS